MKVINFFLLSFLLTTSLFAQDLSKPVITTSGDAVVYAAPDEVRMTLGIETTGVKIVEVKSRNNELSKAAITYLKKEGIKAEHIQTQYLRVSKLHRSVMVDGTRHLFGANQTINICIKDLNKYTQIVDGLLELGVTTISSPNFRNTNLRKFKDEARVKATLDAKEKAELLVKTLGSRLGNVYQIKEVNLGWQRNNQNAYATTSNNSVPDAEGELSFAPGQLEVRARVEVIFLLGH